MIKSFTTTILLLAILVTTQAQNVQQKNGGHCEDPAFHEKVQGQLEFTVPTIDCDALRDLSGKVHILDAREKAEFETSHIPNAIHIGYQDRDDNALTGIHINDRIVVYCSVGYRSEKVGEWLQEMGFQSVENLYGSIFEWANRGYPLEDMNGSPTTTVHTYNRKWSKWVDSSRSKIVW